MPVFGKHWFASFFAKHTVARPATTGDEHQIVLVSKPTERVWYFLARKTCCDGATIFHDGEIDAITRPLQISRSTT